MKVISNSRIRMEVKIKVTMITKMEKNKAIKVINRRWKSILFLFISTLNYPSLISHCWLNKNCCSNSLYLISNASFPKSMESNYTRSVWKATKYRSRMFYMLWNIPSLITCILQKYHSLRSTANWFLIESSNRNLKKLV